MEPFFKEKLIAAIALTLRAGMNVVRGEYALQCRGAPAYGYEIVRVPNRSKWLVTVPQGQPETAAQMFVDYLEETKQLD